MQNLKNDYCILKFTDADNKYRPYLAQVNARKGYLYATDAAVIAKIKADKCVKKYSKVPKWPNGEAVFQQHNSKSKYTVNTEELFGELMKLEVCFRPGLVECDECDGSGKSECHCCGNVAECNECDATGKVSGSRIILESDSDVTFRNRRYSVEYIRRIIEMAVFLGIETISVSEDENPKHGTIFTIGDFKVLLMPKHTQE